MYENELDYNMEKLATSLGGGGERERIKNIYKLHTLENTKNNL